MTRTRCFFYPLNNFCNLVQLLPRWFFAAQQLVQFSAITASMGSWLFNNHEVLTTEWEPEGQAQRSKLFKI